MTYRMNQAHAATISSLPLPGVEFVRESQIFSVLGKIRGLDIAFLGGFLCLLQVLDGILTAIGVSHFGTDAEGNAIIRLLMNQIGHIPALFVVKAIAIAVILVLVKLAPRVEWLPNALRGMIALYLTVAVLPWTYIVIHHIL